jgi:hypothetical protein
MGNMRFNSWVCKLSILTAVLGGFIGSADAVPYASGISNTAGSTWEFVLNQDATNVSVTRNGGNVVNLGALTAGRHTFDMTGFSNFDIKVSNNAATAWTALNESSASLFDDFERPTGMAVNSNPTDLKFFGTIYVNNSNTAATATGRTMGDGVYPLTADLKGVNLPTFAAVTNASDITQAKAPNWNVSGSTSSAWRMSLDDGGNVIVSDWSDANGGMKWASKDLSDGGPLLNTQGGPQFGIENPTLPGTYMHGSIVSKPYVTGTVGVNLTAYGIDEDLESSTGAGDGDNLWKWNVGSVKDHTGYVGNPTLVFGGNNLVNGASSPTDTAGTAWYEHDGGHFADAFFSPQYNRWYLAPASTSGFEKSSLLVIDASGAQPTVKWSSKQFSIDHGLDGNTDNPSFLNTDATPINDTLGINDILREAWGMKMSPDGKQLYVVLSKAHIIADADGSVNPYIGPASSGVPGAVLIIPLDASGLPDIQINNNGTPGNTADDFITNIKTLPITLPASGNLDRVNIDLDAAGNVYVTSNITEKLVVFSPGGNTLATTSSGGTFSLTALAGGLAGDYNNDGKVDMRDYVLWRNGGPLQNGGSTGPGGYAIWRSNFGSTAGSGVGQTAAVPEPMSVLLVLCGVGVFGLRRARAKK